MYKKCEEILNKLESEGKIKISDYQFPQKQDLKLRLKDMLEDEVDEKYYLSDKMINFFYKNEQIQKEKGNGFRFNVTDGNVIAKTITTRAGSRMDDNFLKIKEATKQGYKEAYNGDSVNLAYPESETRRGRVGNQVAQTLQCNDSMGVVESYVSKKYSDFKKENGYIPELFNPYNRKEIEDVAPTQSTQCGSTTSSATVLLKDNLRIRKLSPLEVWRLMGFDDEDFEKAALVNSNAQLYKQAGNSIVVNVLEAILTNLLK